MQIFNYLKDNKNLSWSLALHIFVFIFFGFGIGFSVHKMTIKSQPIIVDLSKIEIAPKTNLPPKVEQKKAKDVKQKEAKYAPPKPKKSPPKEVKKAEPKIVEEKKKTNTEIKQKPKTKEVQPKKNEPDLSSLLASVEKLKPQEKPQTTEQKKDEKIEQSNTGIKDGTNGNPDLAITIGEKDAIASKLRACWNIDVGVKGVVDMQIGIRTSLDKDGNVKDVTIVDNNKYKNNQVFRAVADSARRAVYVCDKKGAESPFKILAKNYPDKYKMWENVYLQFNPLDGGIY